MSVRVSVRARAEVIMWPVRLIRVRVSDESEGQREGEVSVTAKIVFIRVSRGW